SDHQEDRQPNTKDETLCRDQGTSFLSDGRASPPETMRHADIVFIRAGRDACVHPVLAFAGISGAREWRRRQMISAPLIGGM
ncbi:hypothetical protein ACQJ1P_26145, partial [Klebsiella pneumoniae]|uniref:hypothetical protein n=1 Tax=Klebsiella pneumoniae TaxID=573 RepID=UPI003D087498